MGRWKTESVDAAGVYEQTLWGGVHRTCWSAFSAARKTCGDMNWWQVRTGKNAVVKRKDIRPFEGTVSWYRWESCGQAAKMTNLTMENMEYYRNKKIRRKPCFTGRIKTFWVTGFPKYNILWKMVFEKNTKMKFWNWVPFFWFLYFLQREIIFPKAFRRWVLFSLAGLYTLYFSQISQ